MLGLATIYVVTNKNVPTNINIIEDEVTDRNFATETLTPYDSEAMGVSFAYVSGSEGYTLIEPESIGNEREDFVGGVVLIRTKDYEDMQNGPDRGGPPAITVRAFTVSDTHLLDWLQENSYFTNYQPNQGETVSVGGIEGIQYGWGGMFNGETVAVLYLGRVYMFEGTYSEMEDQRLTDFRNIIETVSFATPEQLTLTGTYDCLDENTVINPPNESCSRGIRTAEGLTYSLDFMLMSQTLPILQTGDTITVSGVFTPVERLSASIWADFGVEGILSVTTFTNESE